MVVRTAVGSEVKGVGLRGRRDGSRGRRNGNVGSTDERWRLLRIGGGRGLLRKEPAVDVLVAHWRRLEFAGHG